MKFVVLFDPTKTKPDERIITFRHDDPGPLPPIINPPKPDEPKDAAPPTPEEKPKPS